MYEMTTIETIQNAMQRAERVRPKVGGFPYLAECLRQAGVRQNIWTLPACQSLFITETGNAVMTMPSLISEMTEVPEFNEEEFLRVLRADQAGEITFPEFIEGTWQAGVTSYQVDFKKREVIYYGYKDGNQVSYAEIYPQVTIEE